MRRWSGMTVVTVALAAAGSCGRDAPPTTPSTVETAATDRVDGVTLKAPAPAIIAPSDGFAFQYFETEMRFSWRNVTGTYARVPVHYELQITGTPALPVVQCPAGTGTVTTCVVPVRTAFEHGMRPVSHQEWRVRAMHNGFAGPWATSSFLSPHRLVGLVTVPAVLVLPRGGSASVSARAVFLVGASSTTTLDISDTVPWVAAQPAVAIGHQGLVSAVNVGQTTFTFSVAGFSTTLPVTVMDESSRRLFLSGRVAVRCSQRAMGVTQIRLDGHRIGGAGASESGESAVIATTRRSPAAENVLTPFSRELSVVITPRFAFSSGSTCIADPYRFEVVDADTGEVVRYVDLPRIEMPASTSGEDIVFRWPISVPAFVFDREP